MIEHFEAFLIAITILTLTPGLDTALILRNATRGGLPDGIITSTGICLGLFVHATFSAIGISALLAQSAYLFNMVKLAGAGYLIWLGISSLKNIYKNPLTLSNKQPSGETHLNVRRSLREGFLSNVLNPKTAVFYLAFLPQFINPESSAFAQSQLMAAIHFVIAMVWQCSLVFALSYAKQLLQSPLFTRWMEASTGIVLVGLGIKLAIEKQ